MLSRVANSIYWISRYIERAENYARFIEANINLMLDLPSPVKEQWEPLIMVTGDSSLFMSKYQEYTKNNVIKFLVTDKDNPNSIISCIAKARENARTVQEVINSGMWFQINELFLTIKNRLLKRNWDNDTLDELISEIFKGSHLLNGIMDATFSHNEAWHFAYMGRMLERADKTIRIINMKNYYLLDSEKVVNSTSLGLLQWTSLLKSVSAHEMYRKKYPQLKVEKIVEFLLLDNSFPRAVKYTIARAERSLHIITGNQSFAFTCSCEKEIGKLRAKLEFTEVSEIFEKGLHEFLDSVLVKINAVGDSIFETFFDVKNDRVIDSNGLMMSESSYLQ
jgi:uncharacterized alpha-E superfamily protein